MSDTTHPPIPPNCKWFSEVNRDHWHFSFDWHPALDGTLVFDLKQMTLFQQTRPVHYVVPIEPKFLYMIASIARCAWLDEAQRLAIVYESKHGEFDTDYGYVDRDAWLCHKCDNYEAACHNAEAWRLWGKGEPWK